jgi:hypothetical protein
MPASEIMSDFKKGQLHSGKGGKIVKNPKQAKAILLSYLRKEGKITTPDPNDMASHMNSMKSKGTLKTKAKY